MQQAGVPTPELTEILDSLMENLASPHGTMVGPVACRDNEK